jgi:multiple antibiotic resistance protein
VKSIGEFLSWVGVALITLIPIINPISAAVLLLGISAHLSKKERDRHIIRAYILNDCYHGYVSFILPQCYGRFGISILGIRIASGPVIGFLGLQMLFPDKDQITGEGRQEACQKSDI